MLVLGYPAIVRFNAPSAEGKAKAHAGFGRLPAARSDEQLVDITNRETAALVLDLDEHVFGAGANPEHDGGTSSRELECVLQEVHHDRGEDLPVSLNDHSIFDRHHA